MEGPRKVTRCDVCRRREASNTWSEMTGDTCVRERRICDVCVRIRSALARATACANCGKKHARKCKLRFSPGGMEMGVYLCRQCWGRQSIVDRIHRKIKGVVKRRREDDEGSLQRDIERFLRRQNGQGG
ncbi:MAG: hypothetical protein HYY18_19055 [Planctomycetes bacterium]|nr:hypothetical protein [Planctomycetota bacterium]